MAEKKICSVCRKKINGINSIANMIEGSLICSQCYEKLAPFKMSKKYKNFDELQEAQLDCLNKAMELKFPEDVIENLKKHFNVKKNNLEIRKNMDCYLMTTGGLLQGYEIQEYLGIVTGHVVLGTGIFSGFEASMADLTGSESVAYTERLDKAKEIAQNRAIQKSIILGGNALIGVDVEFTTFYRDMMAVVVTGTSVKVKKP